MCRWVVEVVNGRIKRDYRMFRQEYFNRAMDHAMLDFKIACALLNKFYKLIEDRPEDQEYVTIAKSKLNVPNHLGDYIVRENINRRRVIFTPVCANIPH